VSLGFEDREEMKPRQRHGHGDVSGELSLEEVRARLQAAMGALKADVEAAYRQVVLRGPS
jgi:hypothetical protein